MPSVFDICEGNNGVPTWKFSQTDFAVWRRIFGDPATRYGICAALSAHWIKHHAHGGALANELGGGGVGELNVRKLNEIAWHHANESRGDGDYQRSRLGQWLQHNKLVPLQTSRSIRNDRPNAWMARTKPLDENDGGIGGAIADIEGAMVRAMRKHNNCYLRLNFGGKVMRLKDAGHAVAVWLGGPSYGSGGDAMFFDPNYGEFWFENKEDFFRFFPYFYRATYLAGIMNFNRRWEILPCALRA